MKNFSHLSDKDIYKIAKRFGTEALQARRKFAGILPEIYRRELREREAGRSWFKKRGFTCIYEFAAKLSGMSREQVNLVLRLEKKFNDKPFLKEALVNGDISANKLARVAALATEENQQELLKKAEILSSRALEVFVHDLQKPKEAAKSMHVQTLSIDIPDPQAKLNLDEDVMEQLLEMQNRGIDINEFLRQALRQRKEKIDQEKEVLAQKESQKAEDRAMIGYPAPRYLSLKIKKVIKDEFGSRCAVKKCGRKAEHLHHKDGFAITKTHDPRRVVPLCRGHHELEHAGQEIE
jgi:hypothetical protein